jgi:hypothetical protein
MNDLSEEERTNEGWRGAAGAVVLIISAGNLSDSASRQ